MNGIIHQDIKLENILLKGDVPKIADFGLAMKAENVKPTSLAQFRGTPYYMAPEVFEGKKFEPSADIWALGLVFLELSLEERIHNILRGN